MESEIREISLIKKDLSVEEYVQFGTLYTLVRKDPEGALILSLLFGVLGIDRFYIGNIGLGVAKLLTLGGLFIWAIIDWFIIRSATRAQNERNIQYIHDCLLRQRGKGGQSCK